MLLIRMVLITMIFMSSNVFADPVAGLPDPFIRDVIPNTGAGSWNEPQTTLRPVPPELCGSKGLLPPGALGASNSKCSNQCVCDQNGNICQWVRYCR